MATTSQAPPARKRFSLRAWFPVLALAAGAGAIALIWSLASDETAPIYTVLYTYVAAGLTVLTLLLWLLFFAPFRRVLRYQILAGVLVLFGIFVACLDFKRMRFTSSLAPRLTFRWELSQDEAVEAHHQQAQGKHGKIEGDLAGNRPDDFAEFRGRRRDGVIVGLALTRDWSANPPRQLWRQPAGAGHSSFAIAGTSGTKERIRHAIAALGLSSPGISATLLPQAIVALEVGSLKLSAVAITLEQRRDDEAVVCYDLTTGRQLWVYAYPAHFTNLVGGNGPRSTPTIADGEVYSLGATGKLLCLDAHTGTKKWDADLLENNANIRWGLSGSPLVFDNLVVVNPGVQLDSAPGTLTAHDRKTGKRVWAAGRTHAGYSSPMFATLGGKRQILLFDGEGLAGYDPKEGTELWRHPWPTQENINASQPLLLGDDRVFISSGYWVGSGLLRIKEEGGRWALPGLGASTVGLLGSPLGQGPLLAASALIPGRTGRWQVKEEWRTTRLRCRFSSPVLYEGHIYGLDEGVLACLDARTGKRLWRQGRYDHGQLLLVNGLLLIVTEKTGELVLVEPSPQGLRELTRSRVLEERITWNVPALSGGRLLVRNSEEMACYDLRAPKE